jgi:hypothetical protein
MPAFEESISMYLVFGASMLPLMLYCWFVLKRIPEPVLSVGNELETA